MKINYLSYNQILDIYRDQINRYGGFGAIRDNNALLSVIANPQRQFAGKDLYPTVKTKAAIFVYSMLKNHPFTDGNKRTAYVCGRMLLRLNRYDVKVLSEYYNLIVAIAKSEASKEDVDEWFQISTATADKEDIRKKERKK